MSENINELKIHETTSPESKNVGSDFEIVKGPELKKLGDELGMIQDYISHDQSVTSEQVKKAEDLLDDLMVDVSGEKFTIKELKNNPEIKKNVEIWEEIEGGNFRNYAKLTMIIPKITKLVLEKNHVLLLNNLISISDQVAETLSEHQGSLYLNDLTSISDTAAKHLAKHTGGQLHLKGLISISDIVAEQFAQHEDWLILDGLASISDQAAELLSKHKNDLHLKGLNSLSDQAAESLSKFKFRLAVSDEIKKQIDKFIK